MKKRGKETKGVAMGMDDAQEKGKGVR